MAIRFMRTAHIHGGKFHEAVAWAKEIAGYGEKKYGIPKIDVYLDANGALGTIRWMMDLADMAALDKVNAQLMTDPDYWKLIAKAFSNGLFFDGKTEDTIMRAI